MRVVECPKCGIDISDTYEPADPSVGIMSGGWYCDTCDIPVNGEDYELHETDVSIFGTGHSNRCPKCSSHNLQTGYGLAGGGLGPYVYCADCWTVINKVEDHT